ncbi:MAG: RNAse HI domain-containing protein, partial [Candidatus Thiodiazotropha taylori]|nr:RNAse HI domain-containing protein [Candidatus Thiodiazotropha taylori]MCW4334707.1 RNAse HI domain-containing protein [Candidatus Thiodiazotropha endolucinida]
TPKILVITLDEKLTFMQHLQNTEKKASRSLKIIREVKGIGKISTSKLLRLYSTLVRTIMEYGSTIWQGSKSRGLLDRVQRKGLALCLGLPSTSSCEAMEVAAGILPLDFRFAETAVRDIAKIQSKSIDRPIKQTLNRCIQSDPGGRYITPMSLALAQANEMKAVTGVDISIIEQEMDYEAGSLALTKRLPTYWSRLGSSKSRTYEQTELGKEMVMDMMMEAQADTTFAFTDGSCQPNPGPCGAGAVLYPPHLDPIPLKKPVCKRGSILLGELVAVQIALEHFLQHLDIISSKLLKIFSDSQSAVGILTLNWKESGYKDITTEIRQTIATLRQKGAAVDISWTPGHASIVGNEVADALAKEAATEAKNQPDCRRSTSILEVKEAIKKTQLSRWQTRWDNAEHGRVFHALVPKVDSKKFLDIPNRKSFCQILQIQTGYSKLSDYRYKLGQCDSNKCTCGEPETPEHFLIHCPNYQHCRETMQLTLSSQLGLNFIDSHTLLSNDEHPELPDWRETIRREVSAYIEATERFSEKIPDSPPPQP